MGSYYLFFGLPDETKFSVTPEIIFEGDTVSLVCENELLSSNVSWRYEEQQLEIQNSSKFSIYTAVFNNMTSVSKLTIRNITPGDAGRSPFNNLCEEWNEELVKKQICNSVLCRRVDSVFLFPKKSPGSTFQN